MRVRYRPEAVAGLEEIFRFVLRVSRSRITAERFVTRILARCRRIGDLPFGGRARDDIAPGLRTVPLEHRAVIAYMVEVDSVRILNVFYGGRDYASLYRREDDDAGC